MKRIYLLSLIVVVTTLSCRKDFVFPDPSLKTILGTWQWESSSGGFAGIATNKTSNPEQAYTIEFKRNGIYTKQSKKDKNKYTYIIEKRSSIFSQNDTWQLELTETGLGINAYIVAQTISFLGNDTLVLSDECNDCFQKMYSRQKNCYCKSSLVGR